MFGLERAAGYSNAVSNIRLKREQNMRVGDL
jgi:hypothetical protein